jgi:hypothetical protein
VLPPFANRKRYVPSFTIGDLLAGRILRTLTEGFGVRVGHLTVISTELARLSNAEPWTSLEKEVLVIDLVEGTCRTSKDSNPAERANIILLCAMKPIMQELRVALLRVRPSADQQSLFLPPVEVEPEARVHRRAP